jgi:hypothetical protein
MENNKFLFLKNNNFVYFSHPKSIKTFLNKDGIEKKNFPLIKLSVGQILIKIIIKSL